MFESPEIGSPNPTSGAESRKSRRLSSEEMGMGNSILCATLLVAFVFLGSAVGATLPAHGPIRVSQSISIRHGNWMPLPVEDMRRAAGDAALSRLTDAGRLDVVNASTHSGVGSLALEVSLIGPAETAKMTITLIVSHQS